MRDERFKPFNGHSVKTMFCNHITVPEKNKLLFNKLVKTESVAQRMKMRERAKRKLTLNLADLGSTEVATTVDLGFSGTGNKAGTREQIQKLR